jgi:hypothetical protein
VSGRVRNDTNPDPEQNADGPSSLHPSRFSTPTGHAECTDITVSKFDPHVENVYVPDEGATNLKNTSAPPPDPP